MTERNDHTTDPAIVAMLTRWRATLDPAVCTPAVMMEAGSLPPHATMIERSESAGAVAACLAMRAPLERIDLVSELWSRADEHSTAVEKVLTARGDLSPERVRELRADAWLWCQRGFVRRVQHAMLELAAGRSFVDQGLVVVDKPPT